MKTQSSTIAAFLTELIEAHMKKSGHPFFTDGHVPHVISEEHKTTANIDSLATVTDLDKDRAFITLCLTDEANFKISIEKIQS